MSAAARIHLPIGPSYVYYDYPYYYSRGYYPTHIGGYVYYPYYYYGSYPRYGVRCFNWHQRCVANNRGFCDHTAARVGACRCL